MLKKRDGQRKVYIVWFNVYEVPGEAILMMTEIRLVLTRKPTGKVHEGNFDDIFMLTGM